MVDTNIYAIICTRSRNFSLTLQKEINYFVECGIVPKILVGASSIFGAYESCISSMKDRLKPEDIIIFCHDDLLFLDAPSKFVSTLKDKINSETGFVGLAGTSEFNEHCVWWGNNRESLKGGVYHISPSKKIHFTDYGPNGSVVVLDGLFLAAKYDVLSKINLSKPDTFSGNWDFYDIYYTMQTHLLGYINKTIPLQCAHESPGDTTGRTSWHNNRVACSELFKYYLPAHTKSKPPL